jgi:predicted DsbA family dithiol-disulfide isomerase
MLPTCVVYFDFICPFCYLGASRLIRLQAHWAFALDWRGIQIHPETPPQGMPLAAIGDERLRQAATGIVTLAAEEGLDLAIPLTLANSSLAHRMAECARREGAFDEYMQRVFTAYFQEGRDIGDSETIPAIVRDLGISKPAIAAFLDDRRGYAAIISERLRDCATRKFRAFPAVIMGDRQWQGVQTEPVWVDGLRAMGCEPR